MNPRMIVCYICGREYGSKSIEIHIPKCLEKWRATNATLPKSQRKPEPKRPQLQLDVPIRAGQSTAQALNEAAQESAANAQLEPCDNCKRRFLPNQLPRHQKACRPGVDIFKRRVSLKFPFKQLKFQKMTLSAKLLTGQPVALIPEVKAKKRTLIRNGKLQLIPHSRGSTLNESNIVKNSKLNVDNQQIGQQRSAKSINKMENQLAGPSRSKSPPLASKASPSTSRQDMSKQQPQQKQPPEAEAIKLVQCQRCGLRLQSGRLATHLKTCTGKG